MTLIAFPQEKIQAEVEAAAAEQAWTDEESGVRGIPLRRSGESRYRQCDLTAFAEILSQAVALRWQAEDLIVSLHADVPHHFRLARPGRSELGADLDIVSIPGSDRLLALALQAEAVTLGRDAWAVMRPDGAPVYRGPDWSLASDFYYLAPAGAHLQTSTAGGSRG